MSLGALTTTFIPPSSCLSALSGTSYNGTAYIVGPASTGSCFPDNYEPARSNYYSPGICPYGYRSACSSVSGADTVVTCCPGTLTCNTVTGAWASTMGCNSGWNSPDVATISPLTIIDGTSSISVTTTVEPYGAVNAFSYQIRFQATDFQTTSSTTPSSTATPGSTVSTPISSPTTTTSAAGGSGSTGLSSGTVAGIAVGSAVGGILLVVAVGFAFYLGRKSAARKQSDGAKGEGVPLSSSMGDAQQIAMQAPNEYKYDYSRPEELDGWSRPAELGRPHDGHEMPGTSILAEMPDNRHQ